MKQHVGTVDVLVGGFRQIGECYSVLLRNGEESWNQKENEGCVWCRVPLAGLVVIYVSFQRDGFKTSKQPMT